MESSDQPYKTRILSNNHFDPLPDLLQLIDGHCQHVIPESNPFFREELTWLDLITDQRKNQSLYDLVSSLLIKYNHHISWSTQTTGKKNDLVQAILEASIETRALKYAIDHLALAADELYSNSERCMASKSGGEIQGHLFQSTRSVWLVVVDSFGLLDIKQLLLRIRNAYKEGVLEVMEEKKEGAGIGSYLVFRNSLSWIAGVRPNQETLVASRIELDRNNDLTAQTGKSVHLIT